jgi:hypothetical protein
LKLSGKACISSSSQGLWPINPTRDGKESKDMFYAIFPPFPVYSMQQIQSVNALKLKLGFDHLHISSFVLAV